MRRSADPVVINGAHGEGGSAMLRAVLAMAALTQRPARIHHVRGGTRKPGLTSEDLTFIRALEASTAADLTGDEPGSQELSFVPRREARSLKGTFDVGAHEKGLSPGNALIVLHALLPVLAQAGAYSSVTVIGETYNPNTLTFDAFERVTLAAHRRQGLYAYPRLELAGFGYAARGEVRLEVEPSVLEPIEWTTRGELVDCRAVIALAELPEEVGVRGKEQALALARQYDLPLEAEVVTVRSKAPGAFVTVWAEFERGFGCGTAMGARGVRMEHVVRDAFERFRDWYETPATVDPFLADQLLIPAVLAGGESAFTTSAVTRRLVTLSWVVKQFLPVPVTVIGREGEPGTIRVRRE